MGKVLVMVFSIWHIFWKGSLRGHTSYWIKIKIKSYVVYLNNWVGGIIHFTVQTSYGIKYFTMCLSGYANSPTETTFISLKYGMEYIMHYPHEPIMSSRNVFKLNEISHQFSSGRVVQRSIKHRNTPFSFTHTVTHIMQEISLKVSPSPQHLASSTSLS